MMFICTAVSSLLIMLFALFAANDHLILLAQYYVIHDLYNLSHVMICYGTSQLWFFCNFWLFVIFCLAFIQTIRDSFIHLFSSFWDEFFLYLHVHVLISCIWWNSLLPMPAGDGLDFPLLWFPKQKKQKKICAGVKMPLGWIWKAVNNCCFFFNLFWSQ